MRSAECGIGMTLFPPFLILYFAVRSPDSFPLEQAASQTAAQASKRHAPV